MCKGGPLLPSSLVSWSCKYCAIGIVIARNTKITALVMSGTAEVLFSGQFYVTLKVVIKSSPAKCNKTLSGLTTSSVFHFTLCNQTVDCLLLFTDQVQLDTQINKLRSELKVKVNKLRDMEFQSPVPGLMLNPLSRSELSAVGQIMGRHA